MAQQALAYAIRTGNRAQAGRRGLCPFFAHVMVRGDARAGKEPSAKGAEKKFLRQGKGLQDVGRNLHQIWY